MTRSFAVLLCLCFSDKGGLGMVKLHWQSVQVQTCAHSWRSDCSSLRLQPASADLPSFVTGPKFLNIILRS